MRRDVGCAFCHVELTAPVFIISLIGRTGNTQTINTCKFCLLDKLGDRAYHRLVSAFELAGWVQSPLPNL